MRVTASTSMTDEVSGKRGRFVNRPYGVLLPKSEFAGGSVEEIPQSCSASPRKIRGFGMTSNNFEFRIPNSEFSLILPKKKDEEPLRFFVLCKIAGYEL